MVDPTLLRPGRASGFCYFNAPVLAICELLDAGVERVYYVDLDAHHGDGVEEAFADDDRVATLSVHEDGRCWVGVWAMLNGIDPAVQPTPEAEAVLRDLTWNRGAGRNPPEHWFTTLADSPRPGPVREPVRRVANLARHP
ncbi:MAG TPA: hypothetical protein VD978_35500 [Azospirillum sp.]|nr:hypothetical protein [Azospirillum sp.]